MRFNIYRAFWRVKPNVEILYVHRVIPDCNTTSYRDFLAPRPLKNSRGRVWQAKHALHHNGLYILEPYLEEGGRSLQITQ